MFDIDEPGQGIVHLIGPELGLSLPGCLIVCGDSHTCTHGGLGALAFGIGSSELTYVLATQAIIQRRPKTMRVRFEGRLPFGVTAKDLILALIGHIGAAGGTGYAVEYAGSAIRDLSIEGRLTICNLSIELGAKTGLIAPDEKTYDYLRGRTSNRRARPSTQCAMCLSASTAVNSLRCWGRPAPARAPSLT